MSNSNALSATRSMHTGVPTYFRTSCREATQYGDGGYYTHGYILARAVVHECPYDLDNHEWKEEVDALLGLLSRDDDLGTLQWFMRNYPKMTTMIPLRQRKLFLSRVRVAYDDGCFAL